MTWRNSKNKHIYQLGIRKLFIKLISSRDISWPDFYYKILEHNIFFKQFSSSIYSVYEIFKKWILHLIKHAFFFAKDTVATPIIIWINRFVTFCNMTILHSYQGLIIIDKSDYQRFCWQVMLTSDKTLLYVCLWEIKHTIIYRLYLQ